jgi:nucleoside-diphosphate-sugar epimerase
VRIQAEPIRDHVSRDDVAGVLAAVLAQPRSAGQILYVVAGDTPLAEAIA